MRKRYFIHRALVGGVILAAGVLHGCSGSDSTTPSATATLRGTLLWASGAPRSAARSGADPGSRIAGVQVIVDGAPSGTYTDANGEFTLTLEPGAHTVSVQLGDGSSQSITVNVDGVTAMVVEFELEGDGGLSAHEDVDDDGDIDADDDIDDDGDVDDDDADGDIDDDGDVDIDADGDGDVDGDDGDDIDDDPDGEDDAGDDSPDGEDEP